MLLIYKDCRCYSKTEQQFQSEYLNMGNVQGEITAGEIKDIVEVDIFR